MKNDFIKVVCQIHALIRIASGHCRRFDSTITANRYQTDKVISFWKLSVIRHLDNGQPT